MTEIDPTVQLLLDAGVAFAEDLRTDQLLQRIVDVARDLVGARFGALGVVSEDGRRLDDFIHSGLDPDDVEAIGPLPTGKGVLGELLKHHEVLRLDDLGAHHGSSGFPVDHPRMHTFLGVPIHRKGMILGNLYLTEKEGGASFDERDEALVRALAAQAGVAIENARLYATARAQAQQASALVTAVGALGREADQDRILQTIVDSARELVDAEYAALGVLGGEDGDFRTFIHSGMDPLLVDQLGHTPRGRGMLAAVTIERRAIRVEDLRDHPAFQGFPDGHPPMSSFLGVPLAHDGEVVGNLYLTNKRGRPFSQADEDLVIALAGQAAVAIERTRSQARSEETIHRLRLLLQANLSLTGVLDSETVLQTLVDLAREVADAEYAALGVLGDDGESLAAFIHSGIDAETVAKIGPLPKGRGLLGALIVGARPIRLAHMQDHPASVGFPDNHPPMESFLGVPLTYRGRLLGNLYLTNKRGGEQFSEMDEELVAALASQAAVAIENAGEVERERELVDQLRTVDQMKTDFVSLVSHELRTPLVALKGGADLLLDAHDQMDAEARTSIVGAIHRQSVRLEGLITNLLDLSRIESGRLRVDLQPIDLPVFVADLIEQSTLFAAADIRVHADPGVTVHADPVYLRQLLSNLVTNALHYGREPVEIEATDETTHTTVTVRDHGAGVPAEMRDTLFDKFVRGRHGADQPGSGLGLALVRAWAERFGGTIRHEPADPGARFVLELPRAPDQRADA